MVLFIGPPNNTPVTTRPPSVEIFDNMAILNKVDVENIANVEELQPEYECNLESVASNSESNHKQSKKYTSNLKISTGDGSSFACFILKKL